ncbi:MAG: hypothetical protein Q9164_007120, partial [Protoblastenia rupestris]
MSDIVIITAKDMNEAARHFLCWVHDCEGFVRDKREKSWGTVAVGRKSCYVGSRPHAIVIVDESFRSDVKKKDFEEICLQLGEARHLSRKDLETVFEDFHIATPSDDLKARIRVYMNIARRKREWYKHMWSQSTFHKLHTKVTENLTQTPHQSLNIVKLLGPATSVENAFSLFLPEWERIVRKVEVTKGVGAYFDDF